MNSLEQSTAITDDVLIDDNFCHNGSVVSSLQNSFLRFRDQKKKERQILKLSRAGEFNGNGKRTDLYKDALRQKFVNTAKKYIGVPYAERFKADDAPVASLYLDCCALVRKAVTDLQDEFGIVLGKWNQAYQMDTLPIVLQERDLRPGDLIFYEGLYISKRSKSQKHNNVHVEIYIGGETGEATIGSRYCKGNVSIFPSYKFTSTKWTLVQYHFRSIDTWLSGECKSHCEEHLWYSNSLGIEAAAGKKSIFNDDSDCESAGGGEDDENNGENNDDELDEAVGLDEVCICVAKEYNHPIIPLTTTEEISSKPNKINRENESEAKGATSRQKRSQKNITQQPSRSKCTKCLHQRPRSADVTELKPISANPSSSSDTNPIKKLVPRKESIVGRRGGVAREDLGLVTVTGSANPLQKRPHLISHDDMQMKESTLLRKEKEKHKSKGKVEEKEKLSLPYTYYVGKSNGWRLLKDALDKRGWQQLPFEYSFSTRFNLKWVERRSQIDFKAHTAGQLVNHIPNNDCISTKLGLLLTLREKYCRIPPNSVSTVRKATPWLPETYQLDSPADVIAIFSIENQLLQDKIEKLNSKFYLQEKEKESSLGFLRREQSTSASIIHNSQKILEIEGEETNNHLDLVAQSKEEERDRERQGVRDKDKVKERERHEDKEKIKNEGIDEEKIRDKEEGEIDCGCLWIYKPSCNNRGRGIKVLQGKKSLELICYGNITNNPSTNILPSSGILQRYIENPLLVGIKQLKFDVRCYMLIARNDPYYTVYYHPGYCRLSLKKYSTTKESLNDPTIHLTNASIQKKDQLYESYKELQV